MDQPSRGALRPIVRFFQETSRRRVVRVAMGYLVGAWVAAQVGGLIFPLLGFSANALRLLIGVLAGGLPVALWLAWHFDLTPDGLDVTETLAAPGRPGESALLGQRAAATADRQSVGVLAFVDRSRASVDEFRPKPSRRS